MALQTSRLQYNFIFHLIMQHVIFIKNKVTNTHIHTYNTHAPCRPVVSRLVTVGGGRFPKIFDVFQGLKIGIPSGCLQETSIFKILLIDDVNLWPKLECTW